MISLRITVPEYFLISQVQFILLKAKHFDVGSCDLSCIEKGVILFPVFIFDAHSPYKLTPEFSQHPLNFRG